MFCSDKACLVENVSGRNVFDNDKFNTGRFDNDIRQGKPWRYTLRMQTTKIIQKSALLLMIASSGCRHADNKTAPLVKAPAAKAPGVASVATPLKSAAKAPVKMTVSQAMGVDILNALNASPAMQGHRISVGTTANDVMLNGKVKSAAQKKTAESIARQKAPKAKIANNIEVSAK